MQLAVLRAEAALQPRPSSRSYGAVPATQNDSQQGAHVAAQAALRADDPRQSSAAPAAPSSESQDRARGAADPAAAPAAGVGTGGSGGLKVAKLQVGSLTWTCPQSKQSVAGGSGLQCSWPQDMQHACLTWAAFTSQQWRSAYSHNQAAWQWHGHPTRAPPTTVVRRRMVTNAVCAELQGLR